jgi:selenocysteine lyase/cysteine desulfurase
MNLSSAMLLNEGDEIILSKMEHETNVKPWLFMAERLKLKVTWWHSDKPELKLTAENLKPLLSPKVKFVACTHVSNILGSIHDLRSIADAVHEVGALFCVDGVSFAPHRRVDVKAFGVDFYAFSWYKVSNSSPRLCMHTHQHRSTALTLPYCMPSTRPRSM